MPHLPHLIHDLALILITGAIVTLIFRKIKQPLVLGYIIAGFVVGPYFHLAPSVADAQNVKTLAEIGVIFLLFSLGLEFSFKKLMRVGGSASITAFVEIIFITASGYTMGKILGWTTMDSLFLGGMLASSSTTIIIRAFDELGVKTKQFARIVFGVLIVEDIVVILLMVLLSTVAVTKTFEGGEILFTVLKLLFFLALWFIGGIFLLPSFLKLAKKLLDEETLLILSLGLCLGMVVLATKVGFSAELGAFVMGSIIAETTVAEKVEHVLKSVKDLFGTVFFVSVGMMIDPSAMVQYGVPILLVTLLTLFGKLFSTTLGALLSGQPLKQSVQVGMSMAQIGEFAFIVATLGLSLGVISEFLFPVAVGASAITTFTTPYMIKYSDKFYLFLSRILPHKWVKRLNRYSAGAQTIQAEPEWKILFKNYARVVIINSVVVIAILLLSQRYFLPYTMNQVENELFGTLIVTLPTLAVCIPFLWAIIAKRPTGEGYKELWVVEKYNRGPLLIVETGRLLLGIFLTGLLIDQLVSTKVALLTAIPVTVILVFIFSKTIQRFYQRLEGRFIRNLNARGEAAANNKNTLEKKNTQMQLDLAAWDAHIVELEVNQMAPYIGKPLQELAWREQYGINIVYIRRGNYIFHTPARSNSLQAFDNVGILATDEQIQRFKPVFDFGVADVNTAVQIQDISLEKILVDEHSRLKGKTIRDSGLREKVQGLIVGIERNNQRILNPDSTLVFEWDDIIWIVGNRKKITSFKKEEMENG